MAGSALAERFPSHQNGWPWSREETVEDGAARLKGIMVTNGWVRGSHDSLAILPTRSASRRLLSPWKQQALQQGFTIHAAPTQARQSRILTYWV